MIIMASKSPRRKELLGMITDNFRCIVSDVEEICPDGLSAIEECSLFARQKCEAVAAEHPCDTVIGCDTVVFLDGETLGKPKNPDEARRMVQKLRNNVHTVHTAVCVKKDGICHEFVCSTNVRFFDIPDADIEAYIRTDEPYDKAGAYGIQQTMGKYVDSIEGDYFNIMGLPVSRLYRLLREIGAL